MLIVLVVSCTKDTTSPVCNGQIVCEEFPDLLSTFFLNSPIQKKSPVYNPLNNNEILYNLINNNLGTKELVKYNLISGVSNVIVSDVKVIGMPKWDESGYIIYENQLDYQIWRVKDDGSDLTQVTSSIYNLFVDFGSSENEILYQHTPTLGVPYYLFRHNVQSGGIDTLANEYTGAIDIKDNMLLAETFVGQDQVLSIRDLNTNNLTNVFNLTQNNMAGLIGLQFSPTENKIYFTTNSVLETRALYSINTDGSGLVLLKKNCDNFQIKTFDVSSNGQKILLEGVDYELLTNSDGDYTGEILTTPSIYTLGISSKVISEIEF